MDGCPGENELAAYLDGALAGREEAGLRLHLQHCAKCRKAVRELRELMSLAPLDPGLECLERGRALVGEAAFHGRPVPPPGAARLAQAVRN